MKRICVMLLAILLTVVFAACGSNNQAAPNDPAASSSATADETEKTEEVETPYAVLKYPAAYRNRLKSTVSSENPYTVTFTAADRTELFSFVFNGEGETLIGTIIGEKENTVIRLNTPVLDQKDKNYETNIQLQELSSYIITQLKKDYSLTLNVVEERVDDATFDIKTDVVTLKYPAKWKDKVSVDVTEDAVRFTCGDAKLFDVSFVKTDDSYLVGKYKDTPIYVVLYQLEKGDMTEERFAELNYMQEDHSVILNHLKEEADYTSEAK